MKQFYIGVLKNLTNCLKMWYEEERIGSNGTKRRHSDLIDERSDTNLHSSDRVCSAVAVIVSTHPIVNFHLYSEPWPFDG